MQRTPGHRVKGLTAVAVAGAVSLALAGCGRAAGPVLPTTRQSPVAVPRVEGSHTLAELGFVNGPSEFALPASTRLVQRVDQPNVVTLVFAAPAADVLGPWVAERALEGRWQVVVEGDGSLVVRRAAGGATWEGAYASGPTPALTFRRVG
ncbi:hypothetical protein GCM10027418_21940 [Mariniluteicoccus endophyticus]